MSKNLRCKTRQPLAELIPLSTPFLLRIEPTNACNLSCVFCPTGDKKLLRKFRRPLGVMNYELYKKIIDDLKDFDVKIKKLFFYKDGEPLLNPKLVDMILYANHNDVAEEMWITTNGTLLNPRINRALVKAGLKVIKISIYGISSEQYYKICHNEINYKRLIDNIRDLYENRGSCHIHVKLVRGKLLPGEKNKFVRDFGEISSSLGIENLMGWSMSNIKDFTMGTNPVTTTDGLPLVPKEICPYPFYSLAVNFNGTVSVCCADWSHKTIVGDLRKESLREVWTGKQLYDFCIMHLRKERHRNCACGNCQYLSTILDYIDDKADRIYQRLLYNKPTK
ncbi:radical SAM/SPASM domain-containing protein [Candidatus Omnitrophota bacterium]